LFPEPVVEPFLLLHINIFSRGRPLLFTKEQVRA
jgi:hypothetical protein